MYTNSKTAAGDARFPEPAEVYRASEWRLPPTRKHHEEDTGGRAVYYLQVGHLTEDLLRRLLL